MNMNINQAIRFAAYAHKNQKRKGSKTPYITHPMTVGLILAKHNLPDAVIMAGILHDTIEDCHVSPHEIAANFGDAVARTVSLVSNLEPFDTYEKRTVAVLEKIRSTYTPEAVYVRSADVLANCADIILDAAAGADVFSRFKGTRNEVLAKQIRVINELIYKMPESPLVPELASTRSSLSHLM